MPEELHALHPVWDKPWLKLRSSIDGEWYAKVFLHDAAQDKVKEAKEMDDTVFTVLLTDLTAVWQQQQTFSAMLAAIGMQRGNQALTKDWRNICNVLQGLDRALANPKSEGNSFELKRIGDLAAMTVRWKQGRLALSWGFDCQRYPAAQAAALLRDTLIRPLLTLNKALEQQKDELLERIHAQVPLLLRSRTLSSDAPRK